MFDLIVRKSGVERNREWHCDNAPASIFGRRAARLPTAARRRPPPLAIQSPLAVDAYTALLLPVR